MLSTQNNNAALAAMANLPQQVETGTTRDELSELSGISARNISKVKNIISTGSDELIETVRAGDISINVSEDIAKSELC